MCSVPLVGELQLCCGAGQPSKILPRWHRREGPEGRQPYTDFGNGVADDEEVKHLE